MAGAVKGITIQFDANASKLDQALKDIKKESKATATELKYIDKAIKFNPTSIDAWRQKQIVLTKAIKETEQQLTLMKTALSEMEAKGLNAENSEEFRRMQREIDQTERYLKSLQNELKAVGNVKLRAASEQFKSWGKSLESAGQAMRGLSMAAAAVATSIGALTVKSGQWADDLNTMSKRYGIATDDLQKYSVAADLVDVSTEAIAKSQTRLKKSMLSASQGSKTQTEAFARLGVSVTNADGSLRDGEDVFQDTITALGSMTNETERDALAMQLMGKSANELNPLIEDGGETYKRVSDTLKKYGLDFIDQETLDRANQFNDELDTIKAVGLVAFQSIGAQLAGYLAPALEKVTAVVGKFAKWLSNLSPVTLTVIASIAGVLAVLSPLLIGLGKLSFAISSILGLMAKIAPALGGIAAAAPIVAAVIAGLVVAGVLLYKNWDKIKAKAKEIWKVVGPTFKKIGATIKKVWSEVWATTKSVFKAIKKFLDPIVKAYVSLMKTQFGAIKKIFDTNIKPLLPLFKTVFNGIKKFLEPVVKGFATLIKVQFTLMKTIISTTLKVIQKVIVTTFKAIEVIIKVATGGWVTIITTAWNLIKTNITTILNAIKLVITTVFNAISTFITTVWNTIKTTITNAVNAIKNTVTTVFNAIKSTITTIWNSIKTTITNAVNSIKTTVTSVFNAVRSTVASIWNGIKTAITTPINAAWNAVSSVVNGIRSTVSSVFSSLRSTVSSVWNGIKSAITGPIESAKNTVSNIVSRIKGLFPLNLGKIMNLSLPHISIGSKSRTFMGKKITVPDFSISWYKKGAIFTQPTMFATPNGMKGVGEAGAEAVLPLSELWNEMDKISNAIVTNVTANQQRQDVLLAQLVELNALMLEQLKSDKDFKIDGRVAGRIINDLVRV